MANTGNPDQENCCRQWQLFRGYEPHTRVLCCELGKGRSRSGAQSSAERRRQRCRSGTAVVNWSALV